MKRWMAAVLALILLSGLSAESLTIVNRTGFTLELIQAAAAGEDRWGDDLIASSVLLDGESVLVDLVGDSPWSFRFLDSAGEVYVVYGAESSASGKIAVGPEHLARLARFAGARRSVEFTNRTGAVITSLYISGVNQDTWGDELLKGGFVRDGETIRVDLETTPGALSFDLRFTLLRGDIERDVVKYSVFLTDGASLVLGTDS